MTLWLIACGVFALVVIGIALYANPILPFGVAPPAREAALFPAHGTSPEGKKNAPANWESRSVGSAELEARN